jgi:transposase
MLEVNAWRQGRGDRPLASYQELCQELAASGPGTFGELDTAGARSVLRRYSDAWLATAKRRRQGDETARFPRRRRSMVPVRWYCGRFTVDGRRLRVPVAKGCPPLQVRLDRDVPYPPGQVRSVTLVYETGRLWVDVTAEVPVATYPAGAEPDAGRVAGVDPGIIHPYAVAGPPGEALLVSGRAIRAEHRLFGPPRPVRRGHHRRQAWRRDHASHRASSWCHAPPRRITSSRCVPGAT